MVSAAVMLTPGSLLGRYTIVSVLGRGGVGEVYLADDPQLRRRVAIKVLNAKFAADDQARARFLREAQMAAALDHPNICTLYEIGDEQGVEYLVMQALEGETLAARLARGRPALTETFEIALQLADALGYAHQRGVVHRDIKPQNVMLTPRVKLMDFGLAKAPGRLEDQQETQTALSQAGVFFGTIPYMAPEQLEGMPADTRSDVFSLGVTLYELFAGRHPFASSTAAATITAIASRPAPVLSDVAPDIPRALSSILAKALAADRDTRYQSASELHAALDAVRRGGDGRSSERRVGVPRVLAGAAVLLVLGAAVWGLASYIGARRVMPPTVLAPVAPAPALTAWLEIQPGEQRGVGTWQDSTGSDVLRKGSRFRVHVVPNGRGSLYIVSDERPLSGSVGDLTLLYPTIDASGVIDGALTTEPYVVGGPAADADVWIVLAREHVPALEAVTRLANPVDRGVIGDPARAAAIRRLLADAATRSTSSEDPAARRVSVRSAADVVVHRFSLQQR
jgi:hypothetical protein